MKYTILGAAKSGVAAAELANRLGHEVFVSEYKPSSEQTTVFNHLTTLGIKSEFGGHTHRALECDCIITSPGVKPTNEIFRLALEQNIPVISELEFAYRHCKNPIIAITGTNGKTTTTALTEYIFNRSGRKAVACGNIGTPLSSIVLDLPHDTIVVAETSSYQLDRIDTFRPNVAIILNITPDHLEYHGTVDNYAKAKWKISQNQTPDDTLILCADNSLAAECSRHTLAQVQWFSAKPLGKGQSGMYINDTTSELVFVHQHEEEVLMRTEDLCLPGIHNAYNSMAAALASRCFELRNENLRDSLASFTGVEHRLEPVRELNEVEYINDSKATNVNATWYALQSYHSPIVLIAGGRGDNNDYFSLDELVRRNVRSIIAIGEEQDAIFNHFAGMVRVQRADSLKNAVTMARDTAESGDVVLFSPACKSFDMFMNYEHRGHEYKKIVNGL